MRVGVRAEGGSWEEGSSKAALTTDASVPEAGCNDRRPGPPVHDNIGDLYALYHACGKSPSKTESRTSTLVCIYVYMS